MQCKENHFIFSDITIKKDFEETSKVNFKTSVKNIDFGNPPEATRTVNDFVKEQGSMISN